MNAKVETVDAYIAQFPEDVQQVLSALRTIVRQEAPDADEKMAYAIPTYYLNGNLVHFAAYKAHIGFYPAPSGVAAFQEELKDYKTSKGAVQLPLSEPLPADLIRRIVRFRVAENTDKEYTNDHEEKQVNE